MCYTSAYVIYEWYLRKTIPTVSSLCTHSCPRGSITSSLHVFTNPESRQPHFFSMKYIVCFDQFQMDLYLRIIIEYQNANITVIFKEETIFFSKKQLQIKNSGFVKTCDEYVRRWRTCAAWTWSRLPCPAASSCPMATWTFCLFPANIKKEKNR